MRPENMGKHVHLWTRMQYCEFQIPGTFLRGRCWGGERAL